MRIYLNPYCNYGKGMKKWRRIESELRQRIKNFDVEEIISPIGLRDQVFQALKTGERTFIAAGGDGTVNLLLNAILPFSDNYSGIILGAIGLGSSNDFHKPFRHDNYINGVPVKMDMKDICCRDVICVHYEDSQQQCATRYCLINTSIGITAAANAFYNSQTPIMKMIQRCSVEMAIIAAAVKTIFSFRNITCRIADGNSNAQPYSLTNLGVIKNPHFAGGLCYDMAVKTDDGFMGVNLCAGMTMPEAIHTLVKLYKRQFLGYPKTTAWNTQNLRVTARRPFALELDGEVIQATNVTFELLPKYIRCCS